MNAPTKFQVINAPDGTPAFVVIPYSEYISQIKASGHFVPHEVLSRVVDGATPLRAWREYLGLTQAEVAARLGVSQPAYAQQERSKKLRKPTREKIARALGITQEQIDWE